MKSSDIFWKIKALLKRLFSGGAGHVKYGGNTPCERKPKNAEEMVAGISATSAAIQSWQQFNDNKKAADTFSKVFENVYGNVENKEAIQYLMCCVPADILETMLERARKCWGNYHTVLKGEFLPEEINEATEAVKKCLCRELGRLMKLNGSIPDKLLNAAWERHCKI